MHFINSMYTQDAGCPIFPFEFISDIQYYLNGQSFDFTDINLLVYNKINSFFDYELLKALLGGYVSSYTLANETPLNYYKFEALPSAPLPSVST